MNIQSNSFILLKSIYNLLDDKSISLTLSVPIVEISNALNLTPEFINVCLEYLNDKELIKCSSTFIKTGNKDVFISAKGIELIEGII